MAKTFNRLRLQLAMGYCSFIATLCKTRMEKSVRIFTGNLSFNTTQQELQKTFEAYGNVESVTLISDRDTGRSKGFAFVEMPSNAEAMAAIAALNGKDVGGRALTVNEARPREERSFSGGGGGGGGYGDRQDRRR